LTETWKTAGKRQPVVIIQTMILLQAVAIHRPTANACVRISASSTLERLKRAYAVFCLDHFPKFATNYGIRG